MVELALVMGIAGLLSALAIPLFMSFYQASRIGSAAQEVVAFLNQGRQLGIRENTGVCVHIGPAAMQYRLGSSCTGPVWVGPGTDAAGNLAVPAGVALAATAHPIFSHLGAASPGATITLTNLQDGRAVRVSVAVSGRVSIGQ